MTALQEVTRQVGADRAGIRGRWAVTAIFFLNGLTLSTYLVRVPSLKVDHHLSTGELGLVSTAFGASALVTMQFVGALVARFGSALLMRLTMFALPLVLVGIGFSRGFVGLAVAAVVMGAVHGTTDVSMNAHAVAVERRLGRPVMSGCHAAWSVSAVVASSIGAGLLAAGVSPLAHFVGVAALVLVAALAVGPFLLPASADRAEAAAGHDDATPRVDGGTGRRGWLTRGLLVLGLTGFVLMIAEGAALTWSGVYLHDSRGASLAVASIAVTAYTGFQTAGRLAGDRLTMRYGAGILFRVGGLAATAGLALAVLSPHPFGVVAGYAIAGIGGSALLPLTFSAAGHAGGTGPGAAAFVARFSTFTYSGVLVGPAIMGWVAELIGLQWTLAALVPLVALVTIVMAKRLPRRQLAG
jgi:MFS family permease